MEPALEGYEIGPSGSPQANSTHVKGSVPSLGVKDELPDCELPGLCENVSFSSRQRRKRKIRYAAAMTCFILYCIVMYGRTYSRTRRARDVRRRAERTARAGDGHEEAQESVTSRG